MKDELPSEAYHCHSMGCGYGHMSVFYAAPTYWYTEKGMSPPKHCPDCREWTKAQIDERVHCEQCGYRMQLTAKYKISHHKGTGPWETPTKCRKCQSMSPFESHFEAPKPREHVSLLAIEEDDDFADIKDGIVPQVRMINTDPISYQAPDGSGRITRQHHIERHMEGSVNQDKGRSSSGLALPGDSFVDMLAGAAEAFSVADPAYAREYLEGNRIVRLTLLASGDIEKTIIEANPGPEGHRIVTTYDSITVGQALATYGSKSRKAVQ